MALTIGIGKNYQEIQKLQNSDWCKLQLIDDGYYSFLYNYFEIAKLSEAESDLIDLYDNCEINDYQLIRLKQVMEICLKDVQWRSEEFEVLTSWVGIQTLETEVRKTITKSRLIDIIETLLTLIDNAISSNLKLICIGD